MAWTKAPQGLVDLFEESLPDDPRIQRRKMFGYPSIFVGGNMCAGLFGERMFARLAPSDVDQLAEAKPFEPMAGRPMRGYVVVPDDVLADEAELAALIAKAVAFTASLPAKEKKARPEKRARA